MILSRYRLVATLLPVALCAVPAQADVLQIGSNGSARWISGPLAQKSPMPGAASPSGSTSYVPAAYSQQVRRVAAKYNLSPALLEAVVWQESRWHADAVSPAGARGLAQLMPATARSLGVDPDDPRANLEGGARYLREQLDRFHGDLVKALAAYNAGPGRVAAAGGVPAIAETKTYVAAILGRLSQMSRSSQ